MGRESERKREGEKEELIMLKPAAQPTACRPHVAQNGFECGQTQICKFSSNIMKFF